MEINATNLDQIFDNNNSRDGKSANGIDLSIKLKDSAFEDFVLEGALPKCPIDKIIKLRCLLICEEFSNGDANQDPTCIIYERESNTRYNISEKRMRLDWTSLSSEQRQSLSSIFSKCLSSNSDLNLCPKSENHKDIKEEKDECSSRRKRKFIKPTRIPQDGVADHSEKFLDLSPDKKSPKMIEETSNDGLGEFPVDLKGVEIPHNLATSLEAVKLQNLITQPITDLSNLFSLNINNATNLSSVLRQNLPVGGTMPHFLNPTVFNSIFENKFRGISPTIFPTVFPGQNPSLTKSGQPIIPNALDLSQFQPFVTIAPNGPRCPVSTATGFINGTPASSMSPRPIRPRVTGSTMISDPTLSSANQVLNNITSMNLQNNGLNKLSNTTKPRSRVKNSDDPNQARRYAKSFDCNQCKQIFTSLSGLCEHTFAIHKAFRCMICDAQFTQRSNLQRHSLRHVGFKPFICNICSKAYYRKDHLVRHIELSHPGTNPKQNITVKLSSADCLQYLENNPPNPNLFITPDDEEGGSNPEVDTFEDMDEEISEEEAKIAEIYENPGEEPDLENEIKSKLVNNALTAVTGSAQELEPVSAKNCSESLVHVSS